MAPHRSRSRAGLCLWFSLAASTVAFAQATPIERAAPGLIESGAPNFEVLGPGVLGLAAAPTDFHVLPDGRLLAVGPHELALGDGVRWEVFRQAAEDPPVEAASVAIDASGNIFAGVPGGFARIDFIDGTRWRATRVAEARAVDGAALPALTSVTMVGRDWFWYSGGGSIVAWQPGGPAEVIGRMHDPERGFAAAGVSYLSDRSTGALQAYRQARLQTVVAAEQTYVTSTITCSMEVPGAGTLVGTIGKGLQWFAAGQVSPFPATGPLGGAQRINDLAPLAGGLLAAAVDNVGVVVFDRDGRIVQVLDRGLDHRLSRPKRLAYTPGGILWVLLNEGLARAEMPSRFSRFEPLVSTGLAFAQPYRFGGKLWLMSDGFTQRGVYDATGRLTHFEIDSAPSYGCSMIELDGVLLAGTRDGIFRRDAENRWSLAVAGPVSAHVRPTPAAPGRWLYAAQNEVGWLRAAGGEFSAERHPVSGLGEVFGAIEDAAGVYWLELGTSRCGRVVLGGDVPTVEILDAAHGVPEGWVNLFILDGRACFNVGGQILRYDDVARRLVPDGALLRRFPELQGALGRPVRDAQGRLWSTARGAIQIRDERAPEESPRETPPEGLKPILFTREAGGAMWLHEKYQLVRYDPAMPEPDRPALRALLTRVEVGDAGRAVFRPAATLPPLPWSENSLIAHFAANHSPLARPVTFEVRLEGSGADWTSLGTGGSAAFNHLAEGPYRLHVRPRSGATVGEEATLAFVVLPPWYRSAGAYISYGVAAVVLLLGAGWTARHAGRREAARLEQMVARRTRELHESNAQLAQQMDATLRHSRELRASEERFRKLNEELEARVSERTAELEAFSYSISHDLRAPLRNISGFVEMLSKRAAGVLDPEGKRFLGIITSETHRLGGLIDALLAFSRLGRAELKRQTVRTGDLVAAVRAEFAHDTANRVIEWRTPTLPDVQGDPTLLRQVFANLIGNAVKFTRTRNPAAIEIGTQPNPMRPGEVILFVRDNGAGFNPRNADKLFRVFQRLHSAKEFEGTGIGLANVQRIVARHGGRVWAEGAPNQGATFYFTLPAAGSPEASAAADGPTASA